MKIESRTKLFIFRIGIIISFKPVIYGHDKFLTIANTTRLKNFKFLESNKILLKSYFI